MCENNAPFCFSYRNTAREMYKTIIIDTMLADPLLKILYTPWNFSGADPATAPTKNARVPRNVSTRTVRKWCHALRGEEVATFVTIRDDGG